MSGIDQYRLEVIKYINIGGKKKLINEQHKCEILYFSSFITHALSTFSRINNDILHDNIQIIDID